MAKRIIEIQYEAKSVDRFWDNFDKLMRNEGMPYDYIIEIRNYFGKALMIAKSREHITVFDEDALNVVHAMMNGYSTAARKVAPILCA